MTAPQRESKLKFYSLGIVVQDKAPGSDQIIVYPVEDIPNVLGDISAVKTNKATIPNATGTAKTSHAQVQNTIIATWIPKGASNRMTSPDVVKSESVEIYRYADTDLYFWCTIFREPSLRRTETVVYAFGNIPGGMKAFDSTTSYWVKVDTKNKSVQFHTANNDGEKAGYDVIFNTAQGTFTLKDTLGNSLILDSQKGMLTAKTNKEVDVNTQTVNVTAAQAVNVTTQTVTINTNTATVNASTTTVNSPNTTCTGNLTVGKNLTVTGVITGNNGGFSASATGITTNGSLQAQGAINSSGNITAAGTVHGTNI